MHGDAKSPGKPKIEVLWEQRLRSCVPRDRLGRVDRRPRKLAKCMQHVLSKDKSCDQLAILEEMERKNPNEPRFATPSSHFLKPEASRVQSGIVVPVGWFQAYRHVSFSSSYIVDKVRVPFIALLSHTLLYCHVRGWFAVLCSNLAFQLSTLRQLWKSAIQLRCFEFFRLVSTRYWRASVWHSKMHKAWKLCTLLIQQPSS